MADGSSTGKIEKKSGFCALCRSRCGCISVVEEGRLVAVEADPAHPTGRSICAKARAAPELVHHAERLLYPLRRTRPKGDTDPGWQRVSWDEALDTCAESLRRVAAESGPEAFAFGVTTPSGTAMSDHIHWVERLIRAYGSPNTVYATEICNWHKDHATAFTYGAGVGVPQWQDSGCILLWGHNPSFSWLTNATAVAAAKRRGARLIVVDPRRVGLAAKADHWLRVRPGSDGALALAMAGVLIEAGAYDSGFIAEWSNGPFLVRDDSGRFLTAGDLGGDLAPDIAPESHVVWDSATDKPCFFDSGRRAYDRQPREPALSGRFEVQAANGPLSCRPAFALYAELCQAHDPARVAEITGVAAEDIVAAALTLWRNRPVSYYAWSGVGQHTNATQTDRAISLLYALTGSYDAVGGNMVAERLPTADVAGRDLISDAQKAKALGLDERPLGPPRDGWVTSRDLYRAILEAVPYQVRGLFGFGGNLLLSQPGGETAEAALRSLEFHIHADLFMTPSASYADLVLPVTTPWEHEALRIGFDGDAAALRHAQLRQAVVPPRGEARSDSWIVFELAKRLGLAEVFFGGSLEAGTRAILAPSGLSLEELRAAPRGIAKTAPPRTRKYAAGGRPGFATPSGRVEVYSQALLDIGQAPLPEYVEPAVSPRSRPDLAKNFPLVLTSAKSTLFCHGQHRNLPSLRARQPDPRVELHPTAAAARGVADGDWVRVTTPRGGMRARACFNASLDPAVVCAQHGWWQACDELDLPAFPALGKGTANYNAMIDNSCNDPISGSIALRSSLCEIEGPI